MAYTVPTDPITGDLYTAAWHVTDVNDNIKYLKSQLPTWANWTPTITVASGTAPTYTAFFSSRYYISEKIVVAKILWKNTSGGTPGNGAGNLIFTLPVTGAFVDTGYSVGYEVVGYGQLYEHAETAASVYVSPASATTAMFCVTPTGFSVPNGITGNHQSATLRAISAWITYEIA